MLRLAIGAQIIVGFINLLTLAPIGLQLVHLFLADLLWIVLVLFLASAFAEQPEAEQDEAVDSAEPAHASR
jgi:cytochrome c oxidase assembly protein subunit 15/protoheme IX farnesyltransferase